MFVVFVHPLPLHPRSFFIELYTRVVGLEEEETVTLVVRRR